MNVLIACEESQRVCSAFRERGCNAYSADIQEPSGGHPEWHIHGDVLPLISGDATFCTMDGFLHHVDKWDLIIAHPPCTYLTVSGNRWFNVAKYGEKAVARFVYRDAACAFFMNFVRANCEHIAIENPIGYMNTHYRKPDCIISPHMFGHNVRKSTCLWLKNLPPLHPTNIVTPETLRSGGKNYSGAAYYAKDENGKILKWSDPRTAKERSKTFLGIAEAMAEQWTRYIESEVIPYGTTNSDKQEHRGDK